jgi:glucose-6-phosphate dehydrogenase assembly protein OpcA
VTALIAQKLVEPDAIESELKAIWEKLAQENKTRACLFNLIVFNRYSARTDYIRSIAQRVIEKFPCRLIFISEDPEAENPYLKTAVSVIVPQSGESSIACDHIDIGVGGTDIERASYLLLPHILPDLPTTLLWTEDPTQSHPLFKPLIKLAHRLIFDSEATDDLFAFAKTVLELKKEGTFDVADLNWARTEEWRNLFASLFHESKRKPLLSALKSLKIVYNQRVTEYFCHLKIQSIYLLAWLSSRLGWQFKKADQPLLQFEFTSVSGESVIANINTTLWENLGPGTVISMRVETKDNDVFDCGRIKEQYHYVNVIIASREKCDLPVQFLFGRTATGHSLVQEICRKGTSVHYLEMLEALMILDKDKLC